MRVSQQEMAKNHKRIVDEATRLMREQGIERPSVADLMKAAGLTHGGFYRHFPTKDALVEAALAAAIDEFSTDLERRFENAPPDAALASYRASYLSGYHAAHPQAGCPLAALGGDVTRGGEGLKQVYGSGFARAAAALMPAMPGDGAAQRQAAIREMVMLIGAVIIARASDAQTAAEVLQACLGANPAPAQQG